MKNFTLIALCAMLFSTGSLVAQPTTAPATPPVRNAADVVSVLGAAYTNIPVNDWFPNWSQSTVVTDVTIAGEALKKYTNFNYQGVQFNAPGPTGINVSTMTKLHLDIWTSDCTAFDVYPIVPGQPEKKVTVNPTASGWNSYDITLTDFALPLSNVIQFKFVSTPFGGTTVYLDNIYFWKPANVPTITGFTVADKLTTDAPFALTAPTSNSSGAFTYMSDNPSVATVSGSTVTITGAGTTTITANQAAAGAYGAGSTSAVLTVSSPGPSTAAPTPTRAIADVIPIFSNAYTDLTGTDFFPNWGQSTVVSEIMITGNATKKYANLNYQGTQFASPINASTMTHLHIDYWSATTNPFDVYLINVPPLAQKEQAVTFTPTTASGWNSIDIPLSSYNTLDLSGVGQFKFVGPTPGGTIYLDNIYFYKTVVVPPAVPTVAAPTPTNPIPNVISLFSGGAYTDLAATNWNIYNGGTLYSEVMIGGNATQKYDNLGYSVSEPTNINATSATTLHVDVWTTAADFKIKLVDFGANGVYNGPGMVDDTESELSFDPTNLPILTNPNGWVSLDIPLGNFTTLAARAHLRQFIISTSITAGGRILAPPAFYLDNIYFYSNVALAVELTNLTAKSVNKTTVLNWQTASEKDNQGFTVERSLNGTDYAAIGQVKGFGTTNTVRNYTFTDATPTNGVNYYRLRQADFNGKETLSKVVSVISGKNFLVLKNTLVQNLLDVTVGEETKGPLSIFNVSGQLVYSAKVQGNQLLDVSALTSGLYIVRTEAGDVSRFVKE
jgi:Bacterial Ig-like domain (group 2)